MKIIIANEHGIFTIPKADTGKEYTFMQDEQGNNCMLIADEETNEQRD